MLDIQPSEELLDLDVEFPESVYSYNGILVPRVTQIIKQCEDQSGLIDWCTKMYYKKAEAITEKALTVGTEVHHKIENFLKYKFNRSTIEDIDYLDISISHDYQRTVDIAYTNFKRWYEEFNQAGFIIEDVIATEHKLVCPWFGGTLDAIFKINGLNYIVDFKTSTSIRWNYLIQAAAYMWTINNGYAPELPKINGIGIIRLYKNTAGFEDLFVNEIYSPQNLIEYQKCFCSYVDAYYRTRYTDNLTADYYYDYDIREIIQR